jgi:hypothetical protein
LDGAIPFTTTPGVKPLTEAILYRVFKQVPRIIDEDSFQAAHRLVGHALLLEEFTVESEPMDTWEWLKSMSSSRRRKVLVKAWQNLKTRGEFHHKFKDISAFVKTELLPYFAGTEAGPDYREKRYVARLIQAPHDETHIVAGPYLKPLVKRLKEVWHNGNWIFYASVKPSKMDEWLSRISGAESFFWSDYSAFDATYSRQAWALIESLYHKIYPEGEVEFWEVLEIWRAPHGKVRCRKEDMKVEYQAEVCNASGRDDTALANALLNGIVLSLSFAAAIAQKRVGELTVADIAHAAELVDIAIVGDDSLVGCKFDVAPLVPAITRNIEGFGLQVESNSSYSLADVTFLGMMPYLVGGRYYWGPTLGRRLYKAFWQAEAIGNPAAWARGVAQQMKLYANVPILYDLAAKVDELLHGHKVTVVTPDENRVWHSIDQANPHWDQTTLEWLSRRYAKQGVTSAMIRRDLKVISQIRRLPAIVHLETLDIAVCTDDL